MTSMAATVALTASITMIVFASRGQQKGGRGLTLRVSIANALDSASSRSAPNCWP